MRWFVSAVLLAGLVGAGSGWARELPEILRDKGVLSASEYEESSQEKKPAEFTVYWKDGLHFDSRDGRFRLKIGGRIQNDWALLRSDGDVRKVLGLDEVETGAELRRARLGMAGTIYSAVNFKIEYDFADGEAKAKDVYIGLTGLPAVGNLRVGHFKEPFSLEEQTSTKHVTFLERALPSVFVPERNTGVMVHSLAAGGRLTWALGAFRDAGEFGKGFGGGAQYNLAARLTALPWYQEGGRQLLHVGFSYSHQFRSDDSVRYRQRPEAHLSPVRFVDTGAITTDGVDLLNPEVALVAGPFSLQGEYVRALVDGSPGSNLGFQGGYVQVSFFLTGENRAYKTSGAAFSRVRPRRNFLGRDGGCGAWEIGLRYSALDLNDEEVRGGELRDVTVGLNWYLNPNTRVAMNYVRADLESVGDSDVFQTRFQVEF